MTDRPSTDYVVVVERTIKGPLEGGETIVRVPGGETAGGLRLEVWGSPDLGRGEVVLLFLAAAGDERWEVVDLAAAWRPHMMFLDVGMPKVNGFELARRLRSQPWAQDVLLIALTGWGKDEDRRQSFEAGFDHHLVKPAELNEIERLCRGGATATATVS